MKIAIVNDLEIAREALKRTLQGSGHRLCWVANDGAEAVAQCRAERPDLVLMDLVMPVMDGVEATRAIMRASPCAILVVTATVSGNASLVYRAMAAGALDAIDTPVLGVAGNADGAGRLLAKVAELAALCGSGRSTPTPAFPMRIPTGWSQPPLLAIGSSTGGPGALAAILGALPAGFDAPVVIAQHVDQRFAPGLAEWLGSQTPLTVRIARAGEVPMPGVVLLAGTNDHLVLGADQTLTYEREPLDEVYRPSVDVLFSSIARHWPRDGVALLLTGMGRDGAEGLGTLRQLGWHTIAQDEATCVVYGMPRAAAEIGAVSEVLPLDQIADAARRAIGLKSGRRSTHR